MAKDLSELQEALINKSESKDKAGEQYEQLGLMSEIFLLIYKNVILTVKNPKNLLFLVITPFLLSGFMALFQMLASDAGLKLLQQPTPQVLQMFSKCKWNNCVTLNYRIIAPNATPDPTSLVWINTVMTSIKQSAGLTDNDVEGGDYLVTVDNLKGYYDSLSKNSNRTQIGLLFCAAGQETFALDTFCQGKAQYTYYLSVNKLNSMAVIFHDLLESFPLDPVAMSLKRLVDNEILAMSQQAQPPEQKSSIDYTVTQYPIGPNRYIENYDMVSSAGAFYYIVTPLFAFLFIQNEIVREKQYRLRQGLNIFGASHTAYWISWLFIANAYALVTSITTYLAGLAFGFGFFTETPFYIIIFFLMYPFTMGLQMMSFFLATLSPTLKSANAVSYAIVLLAIVVQAFTSDYTLISFLFTVDASTFVMILRTVLVFYPPFNYTKFFTHITVNSGYHFDIFQRQWVTPEVHYNIDTFNQQIIGPLPGGGMSDAYSDLISMLLLFSNCLFYGLLAWYFDNVISANRGRGQTLLFPFTRIYRLIFPEKPIANRTAGIKKQGVYFIQDQEQSAIQERNRVFKNYQSDIPALGLRIKELNKTFTKLCSAQRVQAIRQFSVEIEPNQLMAILGHNGAGKTTLINVLTGVLKPDENPQTQITINRQAINKMDDIRKHIGVCSQFDILWDQLTAKDHLYMFARLKNVPQHKIEARIDQMLSFVNLSREKNNKVKGFSGGMKRRLSLAIAAIGNPKIILLDQPTTGLDPKVKQQIWQLIESMKKSKSIILTTHSMEQADVLADRICVMVRGKLKCIGSSLYLKQKYGEGHRLTLNIERSKTEKTMRIIHNQFPTAVVIDYKGGNLIIGINEFEDLLRFIKMLESQDSLGLDEYELKSAIRDWNVSHSTLEEVFMKVTREKEHAA